MTGRKMTSASGVKPLNHYGTREEGCAMLSLICNAAIAFIRLIESYALFRDYVVGLVRVHHTCAFSRP